MLHFGCLPQNAHPCRTAAFIDCRVNQYQGLDTLRTRQGELHGQGPACRVADQDRLLDAKMVQQSCQQGFVPFRTVWFRPLQLIGRSVNPKAGRS